MELGCVENVAPVGAPARSHQPCGSLVYFAVPFGLFQRPHLDSQQRETQGRKLVGAVIELTNNRLPAAAARLGRAVRLSHHDGARQGRGQPAFLPTSLGCSFKRFVPFAIPKAPLVKLHA